MAEPAEQQTKPSCALCGAEGPTHGTLLACFQAMREYVDYSLNDFEKLLDVEIRCVKDDVGDVRREIDNMRCELEGRIDQLENAS